jgi:ABC-2 type transport system ATP-binding protein
MDFAIRTEHLTKIFNNRNVAVNDMSLEVPRGAVFGLLGPNGAGKTTTFRILLGLQRATAGRAEVFGNPCGPNAVEVRRLIGYLPTHPQLPGHLRPIEYLDLLGQLCRIPQEVRKPRLVSLLRAVGLLGQTDQPRPSPPAKRPGWASRPHWSRTRRCWSGTSPPPAWTRPRGDSRST